MSDTPRTDAIVEDMAMSQFANLADLRAAQAVVLEHFAGTLERENAVLLDALTRIHARARQNEIIQQGVGNRDSATAWAHMADVASLAIASMDSSPNSDTVK